MMQFDNRWLHELPADLTTSTTPHRVEGALYSRVQPTPPPNARLVAHSPNVAALLGLTEHDLRTEQWTQALAGGSLIGGMETYATCYGGYQFGSWAEQLGDGRAIFLGEAITAHHGRQELQLKGAGPTPYSRRGDGFAVLRSSIREFLCSEAMHHLGIPTTRALSLTTTGRHVIRDMFYDGHPESEPGAIVCRVAPSFTRFGHFELPAARGDHALLKKLIDFSIRRDFPHLTSLPPEEQIPRWFGEICQRTAYLIAQWMGVGFVHGVMNTDNMSILGLTIDYGPYGWLEDFDPAWTPNTTDASGKRYCFARQPMIGRWNLERLADALSIEVKDTATLTEMLGIYDNTFRQDFQQLFARKLGLNAWHASDEALLEALFALLHQAQIDMTLFFRRLSALDPSQEPASFIFEMSYNSALAQKTLPQWDSWFQKWRSRLRSDNRPLAVQQGQMKANNPCYVLRNYLAQEAIDAAYQGDFAPLRELQELLQRPYEEQSGKEKFARKRPEWAKHAPGCSMLSCSS